MNARIVILTLVAAALVAAPGSVLAQQGPGTCDGSGPHGPMAGPGGGEAFTGHGGHGLLRILPRVAERIGLTQGQLDEIHAIVDSRRSELEGLRDQAAAAREVFHETYDIGDFDEAAFRTFFEAQAQLHVEMQLIGAESVSRVWTVLTIEQQEELLEILELFGSGHGPRHGGGKRLGGDRRGPQ
jgi:Spy/CpxP family protein refolding chaperone